MITKADICRKYVLPKLVATGRDTAHHSFVLKVPPISEHGNVLEIATLFGGADHLREAVAQLQTLLYAE